MRLLAHLLALACVLTYVSGGKNTNEAQAKEFLTYYNELAAGIFRRYALREWAIFENNSLTNRHLLRQEGRLKDTFMRDMRVQAKTFKLSAMSADTHRQLSKIKNIGTAAQTDEVKANELATVLTVMEETVSNAKYCTVPRLSCDYNKPGILLPHYNHKFVSGVWTNWRNNTGTKIKNLFTSYVALSNEAVQLSGYPDLGNQWISKYESKSFRVELQQLYTQIRPLYEQLHAFVRKILKTTHMVSMLRTGQIPANVLGNMMADEWSKIYTNIVIFNGSGNDFKLTLTDLKEGDLLEMADEYLVSLGFDKIDETFYEESITYSKKQGEQAGHRSFVFDFFDQKDYRLAGPRTVGDTQYYDAHNKMTQIQYFMQYRNQPVIYREPANDAFLDAVGGAIELSVRNLDYLKNISLLKTKQISSRTRINYQLMIALEKVALLPFAYVVDEWRWSVFNGSTTADKYNQVWWRLRCDLQGVSPPVHRLENDFDPGAMLEIATNKPYIKHFLSTVLQFQIFKRLCQIARHKGQLHKCNLHKSTEAGDKLRAMMQLGSSVTWKTALKELTGQVRIQTGPMMEYFQPLLKYLKEKNGNEYGWQPACDPRIRVAG